MSSGLTLKIKAGDLENIVSILNSIPTNTPKTTSLQWTLDILQDYETVVKRAMGSVKANGGSVKMSYLTEKGSEYWKNLSPYTLTHYANEQGLRVPSSESDYDTYKYMFKIWDYTGKTKESVKYSAKNMFAGINNDKSTFERALLVEEGDVGKHVPSRPLFSLANDLFVRAITKAMDNEESPLRKALCNEFIETIIIARSGWGKKTHNQHNPFLV